jgi:glutathione S-transferase
MVLKLVGHFLSTCSNRVKIVLEEKGLEYEFERIDLAKGEHKTESYLEKQPFGRVPYLDDDGFIVYGELRPTL